MLCLVEVENSTGGHRDHKKDQKEGKAVHGGHWQR